MGHAAVEGCCRSTVIASCPALLWGTRACITTLPAWLPTMNRIPPNNIGCSLVTSSTKQKEKKNNLSAALPPKARIGAMLKCFVAMSREPAPCSSQMARSAKFGPQRRPRNAHPYTAHSTDTTTGIHRGKQSRWPHDKTAMGRKKVH